MDEQINCVNEVQIMIIYNGNVFYNSEKRLGGMLEDP